MFTSWIQDTHPIQGFSSDGRPVYFFKDPETNHCPWDLDCDCEACLAPTEDEDD